MTKYKIPTDVFVHPDSGEQCLYDPETQWIGTRTNNFSRPISLSAIKGRKQLDKLREWAGSLSKGNQGNE